MQAMHVVVNITSDSEFPSIALLDIVLKEVGERKTFYQPRHKEAGRTRKKRKIKRTEISLPAETTIAFASEGIYYPTTMLLLHNLRNGWRKGKFVTRMLLPVYPLEGRHIELFLCALLPFEHTSSPSAVCV